MSFTVNLPSPSSSSSSRIQKPHLITSHSNLTAEFISLKSSPPLPLLLPRASRRISNGSGNSTNLVDDPRNWSRSINSELFDDENDDDEEEEEERSLDLLVRFIQNVFKKVSKRARKAVRSVLPPSISTKLVGFSVNGVLVLAFLWVLKAFLEYIGFFLLYWIIVVVEVANLKELRN